MKKIALIYGAIAGTIVICSMIFGREVSGGVGIGSSQTFGFSIMFIVLTPFIFLGVKKHRDENLGGVIRFFAAFGLGLMIAVMAAIMYVTIWEVYQLFTDTPFIDTYIETSLAAKQQAGASAEEMAKLTASMEQMRAWYASPLSRIPLTMIEIFPVGALVSLISAAILRKPNILPAKAKH